MLRVRWLAARMGQLDERDVHSIESLLATSVMIDEFYTTTSTNTSCIFFFKWYPIYIYQDVHDDLPLQFLSFSKHVKYKYDTKNILFYHIVYDLYYLYIIIHIFLTLCQNSDSSSTHL